ncbi:MAG: hypothetical protein IJ359_03290 [Erysipelotrichaceae bacterium]|nr:hypothetical protein [Erysipelotrichaceae bacterium]
MKFDQGLLHMFITKDVICDVCREKMSIVGHSFKLETLSCESVYVYDGIMKDMLVQYKELMDEALFPVFLYPFITYIRKKYKGYTLVIVPSSNSALSKRGFSHVEKMFGIMDMKMISCFVKDEVEQKHKSQIERKEIENHIHLVGTLPNTPLLLIDDVCTTGSTLLAMYHQVQNHPYPVKALVCCCHAKYVEIRRWKKFVVWLWWIYTQVV